MAPPFFISNQITNHRFFGTVLKQKQMSETTKQNDAYEFLSSKQTEIASKIEELLIGLTVNEAQELLHCIRRAVGENKIS